MPPRMNSKQQALITAYLMGARAKTQEDMVNCIKLAKGLEHGLSETEIAQAKLEAELELESVKGYHVPNG